MKTTVADPWSSLDSNIDENYFSGNDNGFEDSFVEGDTTQQPDELQRLPDSEQYLARLNSRLKAIKGGTSKRDLINSLANAKEDCIARLIKAGQNLETAEEEELAANPVIRHIAPHLQALTANELVHLLKADVLQASVDEQNNLPPEDKDLENKTDSQLDNQTQDSTSL